jgi:hypothetical protein
MLSVGWVFGDDIKYRIIINLKVINQIKSNQITINRILID